MGDFKVECKAFKELSTIELYDIMNLRQEVFVVEQECAYLDADGKDQVSYHLTMKDGDNLIVYARLLPKGVSYPDFASIGRVVTSSKVRSKGLGKKIMISALNYCEKLFPSQSIKISAQTYLENFYKGFKFETTGEAYLEDDIPHIAMIRP